MHKSLHLLLYCQNTIYWEWKKGNLGEELGTEELDAQHYVPCTLNCKYICILLLVITNCKFLFYMNCNIAVFENELWINICVTFQKQQIF